MLPGLLFAMRGKVYRLRVNRSGCAGLPVEHDRSQPSSRLHTLQLLRHDHQRIRRRERAENTGSLLTRDSRESRAIFGRFEPHPHVVAALAYRRR